MEDGKALIYDPVSGNVENFEINSQTCLGKITEISSDYLIVESDMKNRISRTSLSVFLNSFMDRIRMAKQAVNSFSSLEVQLKTLLPELLKHQKEKQSVREFMGTAADFLENGLCYISSLEEKYGIMSSDNDFNPVKAASLQEQFPDLFNLYSSIYPRLNSHDGFLPEKTADLSVYRIGRGEIEIDGNLNDKGWLSRYRHKVQIESDDIADISACTDGDFIYFSLLIDIKKNKSLYYDYYQEDSNSDRKLISINTLPVPVLKPVFQKKSMLLKSDPDKTVFGVHIFVAPPDFPERFSDGRNVLMDYLLFNPVRCQDGICQDRNLRFNSAPAYGSFFPAGKKLYRIQSSDDTGQRFFRLREKNESSEEDPVSPYIFGNYENREYYPECCFKKAGTAEVFSNDSGMIPPGKYILEVKRKLSAGDNVIPGLPDDEDLNITSSSYILLNSFADFETEEKTVFNILLRLVFRTD